MYPLLKLLHIIAVIAFLGNIATGLFWHAHAARARDPRLLAHTVDGIIRSDRYFTVPGVIGIILSGVAAAMYANLPILRTGWILWTLILFSVSGLIFMFRVALAVRWEIWGAAAVLTPIGGLVLMVLKPGLGGL